MEKARLPNALSDDIWLSILTKLPAKSLLRCRCVCKSWHALISSNHKNLPPAMCGFFCGGIESNNIHFTSLESRTYVDPTSIDSTLSFLPSDSAIELLDCCNGLLLLNYINGGNLCVCNPATKNWTNIPKPPTLSPPPTDPLFILAFSPRCSSHYKIYSIDEEKFEIFSSDKREWELIKVVPLNGEEVPLNDDDDGGVCDASIYYIFLDGIMYMSDGGCTHFIAADVERDVLWRMECPEFNQSGGFCPGHSAGLLHYAVIDDDDMLVWVLRDGGFVLKHRNNIQAVRDKLHSDKFDLLDFHPDLDVIFVVARNILFSYHLTSAEVEEICDFPWHLGKLALIYSPCYSEELD